MRRLLLAIAALLDGGGFSTPASAGVRQQLAQLILGGGLAVDKRCRFASAFLLRAAVRPPEPALRPRPVRNPPSVEMELDGDPLAGLFAELVFDPEVDARLDGGHSRIQIVHIEFKHLALTISGFSKRWMHCREIGQDTHDDGILDFLSAFAGFHNLSQQQIA